MDLPCWRCLLKALLTVQWTSTIGKVSSSSQHAAPRSEALGVGGGARAESGPTGACVVNHAEAPRLREMTSPLNGQRVVYCRKGLSAVAVPVRLDDQLVATLVGGWTSLGNGSPTSSRRKMRSGCPRQVRAALGTSQRAFNGAGRWVSRLAWRLAEDLPELLRSPRSGGPKAVADARAYVEANLTGLLHTGQMSRHVGLCETHFCHVFKAATGFTFSHYVEHRRVEKAKYLLRANPFRRVREIAHAVGFQTVSHFNHIFRTLVGSSPSAWRSRQRRETVL